MGRDYSRTSFSDGEVIFVEGDEANEAYLVHSGVVEIYKIENGMHHTIDRIKEARIFGEMGVISDKPRMASAVARGDVILTCCHRHELERRIEELDKDKSDALKFLVQYCQKLLPYEMMAARPEDNDTKVLDKLAYFLVKDSKDSTGIQKLDPFLRGLYKVLIGYAKRRLPPSYSLDK